MKVTVKVEGLRELDRALGALPKAVARGVLARIAKRALTICRDVARRRAPKDTERLSNSISISREKDFGYLERIRQAYAAGGTSRGVKRTKQNGVAFAVGPVARFARHRRTGKPTGLYAYAQHQEFGTVHTPAQPYMRPAWDATKQDMLTYVSENLGAEIEKSAERLARRRARQGG